MKFLILLIKIFAVLSILLGLGRNYMKERPLYHKFRILQHIVTFVIICLLVVFFIYFYINKK